MPSVISQCSSNFFKQFAITGSSSSYRKNWKIMNFNSGLRFLNNNLKKKTLWTVWCQFILVRWKFKPSGCNQKYQKEAHWSFPSLSMFWVKKPSTMIQFLYEKFWYRYKKICFNGWDSSTVNWDFAAIVNYKIYNFQKDISGWLQKHRVYVSKFQ